MHYLTILKLQIVSALDLTGVAIALPIGYCAHPAGVHSNGICPFKVAYGGGRCPETITSSAPMPCSGVHGTV